MAARTSITGSPDGWLGVHIFYAGDPDPLLTDCVAPVVRWLRDRDLLARYFFIRYWLEGPHIRLRLLPAPGVPAAVVADRVDESVASFLADRPAPDPPVLPTRHYRRMFLAEYDESAWDERYGRDGTMPLQRNNSHRHVAYEREYARYGGPFGVELAEWHFDVSSDTVLRLLPACRSGKTVRLGVSAQLGLILCSAFLGDDDRVTEFLVRYRDFWEKTYASGTTALHSEYDAAYRSMADRLRHRIELTRSALRGDRHEVWSSWASHCRLLRARVAELAGAGRFMSYRGEAPVPVTEPAVAVAELLPSYLHMTNNRLGANVLDEAYLSHLLSAALRERTGTPTRR